MALLSTIVICITAYQCCKLVFAPKESNSSQILNKLNQMSESLEALNAKADALQASLDTVQAAVTATIQSLNDQIATLQGQLATGATAEQIAEVAAKLDATKADLEGTLG